MEDDLLEWDKVNIEHIGRRGIVAREVAEVFANEAGDPGYEVVNGEERWTSVGHTNGMRILVIVWTMRGELIRPVTAFEAGRELTLEYFREKGR